MVARDDEGWWEGELNGIRGLFPSNYVQVLTESDAPTSAATKAPPPLPSQQQNNHANNNVASKTATTTSDTSASSQPPVSASQVAIHIPDPAPVVKPNTSSSSSNNGAAPAKAAANPPAKRVDSKTKYGYVLDTCLVYQCFCAVHTDLYCLFYFSVV